MRNVIQAKTTLPSLLQFFEVCIEIVQAEQKLTEFAQELLYLSVKVTKDSNFTQTPVDQQAQEIIERLRKLMDKQEFITAFATTQKVIESKTLENRQRHKTAVNTREEQERLKNKRKQKM